MKFAWLMPAILCGLVAFSSSLNTGPEVAASQPAPVSVAAPSNSDVYGTTAPIAVPESMFTTPAGILFDVNRGGGGPQLMETLPQGWKPESPLNVSGPMPSDEEIRGAIVKGVNYLLETQNENGSWDVVLEGTMLSDTADQAVDAIAATSLAGYALRRHIKVNPEAIEAALKKAAGFVIDRVYRGKLPLQVWYANWRYTLGLKFLHQEYMISTDEEYRSEIRSVARRMVQGLLKLQLSNSEAPMLEKKRRTRLSSRLKDKAMPSNLGVVLAPPTDEDYRGGALITKVQPGSSGEKTGLKAGDRIFSTEGMRVENALDYYMIEAGFLGGQKIQIGVRREGAKDFVKDVTLDQTWPGYLGLQINPGIGEGPVIEGFLPFSPCKEGLQIGDIITEIDGTEIKNLDDFRAIETNVKPGDKVRLKVLRGEKKKKVSESVEASGAPEGWFYFGIKEEDKGDGNGVPVDGDPSPTSPAGMAGLQDGDRVTWIGDTPILGLDHLIEFVGTVAAGKPYLVKWQRGEEAMEAEMVARPIPQPFDIGAEIDVNPRNLTVFLAEVTKGGAAEKAGMKSGDVFMKINGNDASNYFIFLEPWFNLSAGETATFTMQRGGKEMDFTFELPKLVMTGEEATNEEGGWAYYPEMGESPSFSTAAAVLVLNDVQNDMEIKGLAKVLKDPLKSAGKLIDSLRISDTQNGGQETYVYRGGSKGPESNQSHHDIKGCQGRNAICELALVRLGVSRRNKTSLKKMIDQWTKYRGELDAVRNMEFYNPPGKGGSPHNFDRNWNAAYYWMYGHYHTLLAAKECGGKTYTDINAICVKAVMLDREDDGLWLDHHSFGKLVGTGLALWILGESEGPWRDGYADPTTQEKKEGEMDPEDTPEE